MMRFSLFALAFLLVSCQTVLAAQAGGTVTINVTPQPVSVFRPSQAFGAGVDGLEQGDVAHVYTPTNIQAMSRVGFGPLTYRLRTELGIEAWHWNPKGQWSEGTKHQGYWTSNATPGAALLTCSGYRLPRRGSTIDQAGNDGFSRIDDGDARTFWKSNPYLDSRFTGEDNTLHPQWVVVDLGKRQPINAMRVQWAVPFATRFEVQYWPLPDPSDDTGISNTFGPGAWKAFPRGSVSRGMGGDTVLRLSDAPTAARFVRLWLTAGSATAPKGAIDRRDSLGYAIREIGVGVVDRAGGFHDRMRHGPARARQTLVYASSTDPWHRATDRDSNVEQPGFDRIYRSGLTHALPVLIPTGLLYDTPDNAAAELRWLKARGDAVRGVELGEEPDGQFMRPEDYGALYVQWAAALRRVEPGVVLGGPSLQSSVDGWVAWPDALGDRSWMRRFVGYLRRRGCLADFQFLSFEWYPYDDVCDPPTPVQLALGPTLLSKALGRLRREGLPPRVPIYLSEYGYSSFAGQQEMDLPGALLNADIVGQFLTLGGATAYLYGLEPNSPMREAGCDSWGNLAVFLSDDDRHIKYPLPTFYAARLLTREWAQASGDGVHRVYQAVADVHNAQWQALITAYALHRPDDQWSVLLVNKDPRLSHAVRLRFRDTWSGAAFTLAGPIALIQYSTAQYAWHAHAEQGQPSRDNPPVSRHLSGGTVLLPPYSLSVVRGSWKTLSWKK